LNELPPCRGYASPEGFGDFNSTAGELDEGCIGVFVVAVVG